MLRTRKQTEKELPLLADEMGIPENYDYYCGTNFGQWLRKTDPRAFNQIHNELTQAEETKET